MIRNNKLIKWFFLYKEHWPNHIYKKRHSHTKMLYTFINNFIFSHSLFIQYLSKFWDSANVLLQYYKKNYDKQLKL